MTSTFKDLPVQPDVAASVEDFLSYPKGTDKPLRIYKTFFLSIKIHPFKFILFNFSHYRIRFEINDIILKRIIDIYIIKSTYKN